MGKLVDKIEFRVPTKARDLLDYHAAQRSAADGKVYPSDLMREALEEWLARQGTPLDIDVDRGGKRPNAGRPRRTRTA